MVECVGEGERARIELTIILTCGAGGLGYAHDTKDIDSGLEKPVDYSRLTVVMFTTPCRCYAGA